MPDRLVRSVPPYTVIRPMNPPVRPLVFVGAERDPKTGAVTYSDEPVLIPEAEWDRYYERAVAAGHLSLVKE